MSQYTKEELAEILKRHKRWLEESEGWSDEDRADLRGADLYGADLYGANLRGANLHGANLHGADLRGANLRGANLRGADLRGADLYGANLRGANLHGADLRGADLRGADLYGANLRGANLHGADLYGADLYGANLHGAKNADLILAQTEIVPREGAFVAWKKCRDGAIVKLRIPEGAQRSNATGRKCRASFADVLEIRDKDGNRTDAAYSFFDSEFEYRAGCRVVADYWTADRFVECSGGIHFFLTREEAQAFVW